MSDDLTNLHNWIAGELVRGIVRPVTEAGGTDASIMVVVESVVLGVLHHLHAIGPDGRREDFGMAEAG